VTAAFPPRALQNFAEVMQPLGKAWRNCSEMKWTLFDTPDSCQIWPEAICHLSRTAIQYALCVLVTGKEDSELKP